MNNSELSIIPSAEDALTSAHAYVYAGDKVLNERSKHSMALRDEDCDDRSVAVEGIEVIASAYRQSAKPIEAPERSRAERRDRGLWLLHRSADRHEEWERLRRILDRDVSVGHFRSHLSSSTIKRVIDVLGSLLFLAIVSPLFVVIAIAIKLDSPGAVFFRHHRVGKGGKNFVLWKFRSMKTDVPQYETSPRSVTDFRLTRIGRLIRRLSIDEMPQLINVLRGEMSLVGPRPEMPFIVAQYHPVECERLNVKPGITGLWQISPARAFPIHENLQYDLHYVRNQNLVLDCAIILRTITAVIHGVGAV